MSRAGDNSMRERMLSALRDARVQLEAVKAHVLEPIAVVGMSCRFPGSGEGVESFWQDLRAGVDAVREIPPDRWDIDAYYDATGERPGKIYVREAALLDRIDQFDPGFFGISPREAASMDPQQRLLLEVCWESLENAGFAPDGLAESRTGVFLGIGQNDYARLATAPGRQADISAYDGTGNGFCFAAGRLSYVLGLQGPNLAIDTACSSSLVAVHLAVESLRRRESDCALAAGVQLILSPEATVFLSQTKALAPDGRSKPFDASANGYGRGEGCGVLVLKRLSDALNSRDRILAVIRGSAVNHDGPSSGLTVPNAKAQEALLRAALDNAGVRPDEVGYIEAHGTGTILGDPLELRALGAVFAQGRGKPLLIGSVKANIGHTEAAAGIAGLIKTILMLEYGEIPANVHFHEPNPRIPWRELPFRVPAALAPWTDDRRVAGVSSFSLSGTNAHVIVEEAPVREERQTNPDEPQLLTLSAKTEAALRALVERYRDYVAAGPAVSLGDVCFTANTGRAHLNWRWCAVVASVKDAHAALDGWLAGTATAVMTGSVAPAGRRRVLFSIPSQSWRSLGVDPVEPLSREGALVIEIDPKQAERRTVLASIGQLYLCGFPIDWEALHDASARRIALPTYPFERQRYWLASSNPTHPLLQRKIQSPLLTETLFEGTLSASSPAFLSDHRIAGEIVVPGAFHLSALLAAAKDMLGSTTVELNDVVFPSALVVRKGERYNLQIVLRPEASGGFSFSLISLSGDSWSTHAQGSMTVGKQPDVAAGSKEIWGEQMAPDKLYASLERRGIQLGPAFRWISEVWAREGEASCRMKASVPGDGYLLHPGLIDSCLQLLGAASGDEAGGETFVPFRMERVRFAQPVEHCDLWCSASLRPVTSDTTRTGDVRLMDGERVVLEVTGLEVRAHFSQSDPLYDIAWRALPTAVAGGSAPRGEWLIVSGADGVAPGLEQFLRGCGVNCVFADAENLLPEFGGARFDGIVLMATASAWRSVMDLVRTIPYAPSACLLITRGAQQVSDGPVDPWQSLLWGMQPVLRREHPDWAPVIIDLDPSDHSPVDWSEIFGQARGEDRIVVRDKTCWAPRLVPCSLPAHEAVPVVAGRSYLITGGLGVLGFNTARWLISKGATHVVLAGRSDAGPSAEKAIGDLRAAGAEVHTVAADVADAAEVRKLVRWMGTTLPPLAGVIHAAGVMEDHLLARQDPKSFGRVLAPKVDGAWNVHQETLGTRLDFFICYSSVASLLASPGQGAYAAANAFLDGLMRLRKHMGLPGLSINWGPWGDAGMAARTAAQFGERWKAAGIELLTIDAGLRILGRSFHHCGSQLAVFDFRKLTSRLPEAELPRILSELAPAKPGRVGETQRQSELIRRLAEAEFADRTAMLDEYLREQSSRALGFRAPIRGAEESLIAMGVDSLMALEMRTAIGKELGKEIPIVRFLDGSAIPDLAALLASQFEAGPDEEVLAHSRTPATEHWVEGEI